MPAPPTPPPKPLGLPEFVGLMATMVSIVALSTDIMLPALGQIGRDLGLAGANDAQFIVTSLFVGFGVGQLIAGPLSDRFGRKPVIYGGYVVFIVGCLCSIVAEGFWLMLVGRVLQGLGAAAPRIVTVAIVRDGYEGRAMARIMSIVMVVFILVPAIAPAIGQGVVAVWGWRATFAVLLILAATGSVWFALRQPETFPVEARQPVTVRMLIGGFRQVLGERVTVGYTIAAGFVFGAFLGYLSSVQQIYQATYGVGTLFPFYFGLVALAIGAASILNARLVMRLGMRVLTGYALMVLTGASVVFMPLVVAADGVPNFALFVGWQLVSFGCIGLLFGNLNALAMGPLGRIAGLGAAIVGAVTTLISIPLGALVGRLYSGGVTPLVGGFALLGAASLIAMLITERAPPWRLEGAEREATV